jgi:hypothetical protein
LQLLGRRMIVRLMTIRAERRDDERQGKIG